VTETPLYSHSLPDLSKECHHKKVRMRGEQIKHNSPVNPKPHRGGLGWSPGGGVKTDPSEKPVLHTRGTLPKGVGGWGSLFPQSLLNRFTLGLQWQGFVAFATNFWNGGKKPGRQRRVLGILARLYQRESPENLHGWPKSN